MNIAVLIPAYNEEASIEQTVAALSPLKSSAQIVVINDGSSDRTAQLVAAMPGVTLLDLPENVGKGSALNTGWLAADADIYLLLDGDLGASARYAPRLLTPIMAGRADMTIARLGQQQSCGAKAMGFGFVRRFAAFAIWMLTGARISSPLSGQRAVKGEVLQRLGGFFPGFAVEIGLTVGALHYGFRLEEIPLQMKHRAYGRGLKGMAHRGRQFGHILHALWLCRKKGWTGRC